MMMYDLEKASKSAPGISLYVSDDPQGSNEVLGPDAPEFPDQDGALVYELCGPLVFDAMRGSVRNNPG
jgi:hypothetical protein